MVALLWGGDGAVASYRTAAALWRFPDFPRRGVELTLPKWKAPPAGATVHQAEVSPRDRTHLDRFVVTSPARTLIDLSRCTTRPLFEAAFHYCIHSGLTSVGSMRSASEKHQGRGAFGAAVLRDVVSLYETDLLAPASPFESRVARLLGRSGLPAPRRQYEVSVRGSKRFIDFAWPNLRLGVEADSYRWHSSRAAWEREHKRTQELEQAGWKVLRATAEDVREREQRFLAELKGAYADRERLFSSENVAERR
jgi:very-short-patch-repair endonuclease